ncbi:3'-5' exonuclease [Coralloluteibacterium thermophilus]|uniref:DNA-directed DNA polymerase n=1 Tax=Coralloluteibacterium thermophilum TaxID=2707049 RepID=A0ABV9NKV0_9GAMM
MGLRLRVFLFFALLGLGSAAAIATGAWFAAGRTEAGDALPALVQAALLAGVLVLVLVTWVWLLFDAHVARAVETLAHGLRARAHAAEDAELDAEAARYLGDLAPAAAEVAQGLAITRSALAQATARETARLSVEKARLDALLADLPVAVLVCTAEHRLVLYNARALALLGAVPAPGLDRSLLDTLEEGPLAAAYRQLLAAADPEAACGFRCTATGSGRHLAARMRLLRESEWDGAASAPPYALVLLDAGRDDSAGPALLPATAGGALAYDFDLLARPYAPALAATRLEALTCVVFDTETTGLAPSADAIVQIAAVRVVNGRVVEGETFETLVDPCRPIPAGSTAVHGITDAMVAGAPPVAEAAARFHRFADGAVLVAHNAPFDMEFLRRTEAAIGARFDHPVLDTVLLSAAVFGQREDHSLDALARRLGVVIPEGARHTAMGDAVATAEAFLRLAAILRGRGLDTFGDVLAEMRRHGRVLRG